MPGDKVRLDRHLVNLGLFSSRVQAQGALDEGKIRVDGEIQTRSALLVHRSADIEVLGSLMPFVGRGALKLAYALDEFAINVEGQVALDVGASTGGFTQVLLQRGVQLVYAVDVGTNQLHPTLRADSRVVSLEGTNMRYVEVGMFNRLPSLAVIDVSFISLTLILPAVLRVVLAGGNVVALVKPQFEVGRQHVGKGGLVRDPMRRREALTKVQDAAASMGFNVVAACDSPITGGDGNHEYLIHLSIGDGLPAHGGEGDKA